MTRQEALQTVNEVTQRLENFGEAVMAKKIKEAVEALLPQDRETVGGAA
jgi:hypothetical protein